MKQATQRDGAARLVRITRQLAREVDGLRFAAPVTHVYNPLLYAWGPHRIYLERFGAPPKDVVLIGMNPGPWGMAQTGVPFGEVGMVRDWLGIEARVSKPAGEHPRRPVLGLECPRSEVSGRRLWGWANRRFGTAEQFFARFFVVNYCPLVFMEDSGRNRTPDKLPAAERAALFTLCDRALRGLIDLLQPKLVAGIGRFAADRATAALEGCDLPIGMIPHPSPANPQANKGWEKLADKALREMKARYRDKLQHVP